MKSLYLSSVAIACALSLVACGGDDGNLVLSGSVSGVTKDGLVLKNNGGSPLTVAAGSTSFVFPDLVGTDTNFEITVDAKPSNVEKCTVFNGKGKTGTYSPVSIAVVCEIFQRDLGGSISGLDSSGLILINGSDRQQIAAGATSFTMTKLATDGTYASGRVPEGAPYGITVFQQPAGRTCAVSNGTGIMGGAAVTNVAVTCN
jgi:hypothetical protein